MSGSTRSRGRGASKRNASQSIRGKHGVSSSMVSTGARGAAAAQGDANRPTVFDLDEKTQQQIDRTPKPLCGPTGATTGGGNFPAAAGTVMMGTMAGSMSMAGTLAEGTQLGALSSCMQSSAPSMSAASGSMLQGSLYSNMSGSMMSNNSEERDASSVALLDKKLEVPKAVDLMRAQEKAEVEALTADQLEQTASIFLEETSTVLVFDIKSSIVRLDDEAGKEETTTRNAMIDACMEKKITAADNFNPRGVNTINLILKSKQVQETAPMSVENSFQVYEFDIFDAFADAPTDDLGKSSTIVLEEVNVNLEEEEEAANAATTGTDSMVEAGSMAADESGAASMMPGSTMAANQSTMHPHTMPLDANGVPVTAVVPSSGPLPLSSTAKKALSEKLQVMERMVMQNMYAAKHLLYSGFELPAELRMKNELDDEEEDEDEYSEEEDEESDDDEHIDYRLDKLWSFECEISKGRNVAAVAWSEHELHRHVLAVAYGETDFSKAATKTGAIMLWSLKNPDFPEHVIECRSGVMSLAFSHTHPNLLAVGLYEGSVCLYDIGRRDKKPFLESDYQQKHTAPVWELRWVDQNSERGEKLVSISSDGRITEWTIKKGLEQHDLFKLKKVENPAKQKEMKSEAFISRNASGFCFDFSPSDPQQYICGTEEGNIHMCSRSYNHVLQTYNGHTGPVYKVKFSPFHSGLFLSASADWSCKMWHANSGKMLLSYQPNNTPMTDVCWSPSKPTVFATTSFDGRLQVYDIAQNQMDPACTFVVQNEDPVAVADVKPAEGAAGEEEGHEPHEEAEEAKVQATVQKGNRPVALNALSFGVNSPVVIAGSEDGQVRTFTVHGLSSQQFQKDPVELLEGILMMGQDHTATVEEH